MDLKLYKIGGQMKEILERDEWIEDDEKELTELNLALEKKVDNIVTFCDRLEGFEAAADKEIRRIQGRKQAAQNRRKRLEAYMINALHAAERTEVEVGTRIVGVAKNPPKVVIDNEAEIPSRFVEVVTSHQFDKEAIKKAIKKGETVKGAHVERGERIKVK